MDELKEDQIAKLAKELPQYDVSESLTQKILFEINSSNSSVYLSNLNFYFVFFLSSLGALYLFLMFGSNLQEIILWFASLLILVFLHCLIKISSKYESAF